MNSALEDSELSKKKLSILQEIANAIVFTDNISSIANLMLDLAVSYTNAEKGSLMLVSERDELYILSARGLDSQFIRNYRIKVGDGIAGTVAKNRQPVLVEDIEQDRIFHGKRRDRYKTRSFISSPIVSRNKLLGVLNINDKKDGTPFSNDELELLKIIANHAAIAIENAFLMTQLKVKASELEDTNKKLIETDIIKTEFLTRISHELRTPLNSVKGAIYFLQNTEKILKNEQSEFYDIISTETSKLISIVENLLNFLRIEDETRIIKKTVINVRDILKDLLNAKTLRTMLNRKNILLKTDILDTLSDVVGDRILVIQFFINLIDGLSHFLERGDTIEITAHENEFVIVNIALSRRMHESVLPYLSDTRYVFQLEHPEERLKLYLARNVIEVHKWDLKAENTDDMFKITLTIPKNRRHKIDAFMNTSMDLFVDFISEVLDLNTCSIMLSDKLTNELTIRSARGLDDSIIKRTRIKFGDSIAGWVALEGKPLFVENIEIDPRFSKRSVPQYTTKSLLSLPLKMGENIIGVLNLNNKSTSESFTQSDYYIASALSERISHFIAHLHSDDYREEEFKQFMLSFENLLNVEKRYHKKKTLNPDLTIHVMDKLGTSEEDKKIALYVSLLYDLGLVLIDESVLQKKKLSESEERTLKVHPYNTISLLNRFEYSDDVKNAILHHHERFDGSGYPEGLKGEEIPLISRVLAVLDTFFAMIDNKPYRKAYTKEDAVAEIHRGSGSLYDPKVVSAFEEVVNLF